MAKWGSNFKISLLGRAVWQVQQEAIKSCGSIIHSEHNRLLFIIFLLIDGNQQAIFEGNVQSSN